MKLKAMFWDADGVLIKSKHLFTEQLERDFGMDTKKMLPFFLGVFRECAIGKADLKEELAKVVDDWGWRGTVEELVHYWFTKGTEIDETVLAFVKEIHESGVPTFMVTDNEKYRGEYLRGILEGKVFDNIFFSGELEHRKNEDVFWETVYDAVKEKIPFLEKNEILYIDDDKNDIETAKKFGLTTYHYDGDLETLKKHVAQYGF